MDDDGGGVKKVKQAEKWGEGPSSFRSKTRDVQEEKKTKKKG